MPIDLRHLRYFVATCETGQITGAARSLHMAQPALTQALQALEREVGVQLLDRHPKGVTPTVAGRASTRTRGRRWPRSSSRCHERARNSGGPDAAARVGDRVGGDRPRRAAVPSRTAGHRRSLALARLPRGVAGRRERRDRRVVLYPDYPCGDGVWVEPLARLPVPSRDRHGVALASFRVVRFEDFEDRAWTGQHPSVPEEFADTFYLTAVRGHHPEPAGARR